MAEHNVGRLDLGLVARAKTEYPPQVLKAPERRRASIITTGRTNVGVAREANAVIRNSTGEAFGVFCRHAPKSAAW